MSTHGDASVHREHVLEETIHVLRAERVIDRQRIHDLEQQRASLAAQCVLLRIRLRQATGEGNVEDEPRALVDHVWPLYARRAATHAAPAEGAQPVMDEWIDGPGA